MGDISKGLDRPGYESPESRQLREIRGQVLALAEEVERLKRYVEARARAQEEAYKRMMKALSGATGGGAET